jgi:hypothetical protein
MWLSILDADLPLQLTFLLMENSWAAPGALRNDGWLQTVAVQTWGAQARMLAPSFYPVFGSFPPDPHRYVSVEIATLLRRDVVPDSTPVRARAWREVCGPETNSSGICIHLMVVNTVQDSAVSFTLRLLLEQLRQEDSTSGSTQAWAFPMQASALFETGGYNVTVDQAGRLSDFIGPGQTLIFELGCNGPRELAPGAGRGTGTDEYTQPPWLSCANRRVQCIHGFINNVSGGPPAPNGGRCGERKPSEKVHAPKTGDAYLKTDEIILDVADHDKLVDIPMIMQGLYLGLDTARLPGPPGALDAAMRAGTTHIYVPTAYDGFVRPGCGHGFLYQNRTHPPSDADCRAAGSNSGWNESCGRLSTAASLPFGPQRVFGPGGLAPSWAGDAAGWTCGAFVQQVWTGLWNITFPGGAAAAGQYNLVSLFTQRGLKIIRNVETNFDVLKAGSGYVLTRRPDMGAAILRWQASPDGATVAAMDPLLAKFRAGLIAPTDGFWYDEEWVVGNTTRFPLTAADRHLAEVFVSAGWLNSTSTLNDTTVATLRGGVRSDYYDFRCLQIAIITQMYSFLCQDKFPDTCKLQVPYSAYPAAVQELTGYPYCVSGQEAAGTVGKGVPQRPMKCVDHDPTSGDCVRACGEVFLTGCEALGVDWTMMATQHEWPPQSGLQLPAIGRGMGHTYYWPVDLPASYKDCVRYPLAWSHFIGVNDAVLPTGEIDPAKWGPHIAQRVAHVRYTLEHPSQCHGGFGLGMYTSYALQDPRSSWSLVSVQVESHLVGDALRANGLSTPSLRAYDKRSRGNGTLRCRYGRPPPAGCGVAEYLMGSEACPRDLCYLDPCFYCAGSSCAVKSDETACAAAKGCAWLRRSAVDCW